MKQIGNAPSASGFRDNKQAYREGGMIKSMCRWVLVSSLVCFAFLAGTQTVQAQACTLPCTPQYTGCNNGVPSVLNMYCESQTNGIGASTDTSALPNSNNANLLVGQKVFFLAALQTHSLCCITGGVVTVVLPDGSSHVFDVGCNEICDPGSGCSGF